MRCLYCGKELALLKRLTGGAEFCSDAHRKKYQEEFNDLALSRLLQTQPPPAAKPFAPPPEIVPDPIPTPQPVPPAPTKAARLVPTVPKAATPPTAPRPKAPEQDPVVAVLGYLVEQPSAGEAARAAVGGEPQIPAAIPPALPSRSIVARAMARANDLPWASPVALKFAMQPAASRIHPREGNLEIREFSRKAIAPAVTPQQISVQTNLIAPSGAFGEAMEITNQPYPPADPPVVWQAGPQPAAPVNLLLGDLARLNFATTGFGEDLPSEPSRAIHAPAVPLEAPVAAPPVQVVEVPVPEPVPLAQPVVASQPPAAVVPEPVTKPLPVTLHGLGAGTAKPASILSTGVPSSIEPQLPPSSALPLRPTMILAPRPTPAPAQAPKPLAVPPPAQDAPKPDAPPSGPAAMANTSAVRPLRGTNVNKNRRPEVRVVQTTAPVPVPVQNTQTVAPAPRSVPVARPAPVAPPPAAKAAVKSEPAAPAPKPEIDLHLPELHNPEVVGRWASMPGALKAGIGAVIALGIIGFAYSAMNSSNASAKPTAVAKVVPAYNVGKQINSGGWIEDWAPADKARRITLLRGSQPYSDYRIEFQSQIQNKAIGWMYRGLNPKNYYVVKLEKLKPGIEPVVALVRYAVIDGTNEQRVEKILPMKVRVDTTYKIRFDAVGSEFTAWVQDQKIDEWHDARLGSGGVGLYSEGDEAAAINGTVNVFELTSTR